MAPATAPMTSGTRSPQSSVAPSATKLPIETASDRMMAIAAVAGMIYIGMCRTEAMNGTSRKPPPTPKIAAVIAMTAPATKGDQTGRE